MNNIKFENLEYLFPDKTSVNKNGKLEINNNDLADLVKEFGSPEQDVKDMFPKELRTEIAKTLADEEYAKIQDGEYDVVKGTIS